MHIIYSHLRGFKIEFFGFGFGGGESDGDNWHNMNLIWSGSLEDNYLNDGESYSSGYGDDFGNGYGSGYGEFDDEEKLELFLETTD